MNREKVAEYIGNIDDRYLEEVFQNKEQRRRIIMTKNKRIPIFKTALIAAAAALLLTGTVTAAATFGGLTDGKSAIGSAMTYVVKTAETEEEGNMLANYILAGLSYDKIFKEQQANFGFSGLRPVYHVSFKVGGYAYDVDVDAKTGVVISCDREIDEGWDKYLENEAHGASAGDSRLPDGYYSGVELVAPTPGVEYDMGNISTIETFLIAETYFGLDVEQGDNCTREAPKVSGANYATSPVTHIVQILHAGYVYECSIDSATGEVTELFVGEDPEYNGDNVHKHTKSDEYIGSYQASLIARGEMGLDPDVTPYPSFGSWYPVEGPSEGEVTYHDVYVCMYNKVEGDSQTLTELVLDAQTGEILNKRVSPLHEMGANTMQVPSAEAPDGMISEAEAQIIVLEDLGITDTDIKGFTIELKESENPNEFYYEINITDSAGTPYVYKVNAVSGHISNKGGR